MTPALVVMFFSALSCIALVLLKLAGDRIGAWDQHPGFNAYLAVATIASGVIGFASALLAAGGGT